MLRIGLTGGIGSGKTTVARIFEILGISVYYADVAAKRLMNQDEELIKAISLQFGNDIYFNGKLNRKDLAALVFKDEDKLALLNSLVHPATIKDAEDWMKQQVSPYIIKEAALLFESGSNKYLDIVVGVSAPLQLRMQRTMLRDKITIEQVTARTNKQMNEEKKLALCDYVIINDEQQMILPQVLQLHEKFLQLAQ